MSKIICWGKITQYKGKLRAKKGHKKASIYAVEGNKGNIF